jgi:hypothetical protein
VFTVAAGLHGSGALAADRIAAFLAELGLQSVQTFSTRTVP